MVEGIRRGDIPGIQLRRRRVLEGVSPEDVWPWLVEGSRLSRWLADSVVVEAGTTRLELHSGEVVEHASTVEILPPRRWVLDLARPDWATSTRLTIALSAHPSGCEVVVDEGGFHTLPLSECLTLWEWSRRRWLRALRELAACLAG